MESIEVRMIPIGLFRDPGLAQRVTVSDADMDRLVASVQKIGILQPVGVKAVEGEFEVVWGHRRIEAARRAKLPKVPAVVAKGTELEYERMKWEENRERREVNVLEEALWLDAVQRRHKLSQADLSAMLGMTASYISQRLAVLNWPPNVQKEVASGRLSFSVGRELMRIGNPEYRDRMVEYAVNDGCTAATAARWYRDWLEIERYKRNGGDEDEGEAQAPEYRPNVQDCFNCGGSVDATVAHWLCACPECAVVIRGVNDGFEDGSQAGSGTNQTATE